jgi:uncharacterized membrane protein
MTVSLSALENASFKTYLLTALAVGVAYRLTSNWRVVRDAYLIFNP